MKSYHFYGWETADIQDANGFTPRDYYDMLSALWCAATCAPRMRDAWSTENKTKGQCSITAFLIQDIFGGTVYGIPLGDGNFHCFNVADGCLFDLTSEQFGNIALDYTNCLEQHRDIHFAKEEKRQRYHHLKEALQEAIRERKAAEAKEAQLRRIAHYEAVFDRVAAAVARKNPPKNTEELKADIAALNAYYTGAEWRQDFEADEAGLLPSSLKRGVLSEDGVYNLLEEAQAFFI